MANFGIFVTIRSNGRRGRQAEEVQKISHSLWIDLYDAFGPVDLVCEYSALFLFTRETGMSPVRGTTVYAY